MFQVILFIVENAIFTEYFQRIHTCLLTSFHDFTQLIEKFKQRMYLISINYEICDTCRHTLSIHTLSLKISFEQKLHSDLCNLLTICSKKVLSPCFESIPFFNASKFSELLMRRMLQ